jgi:uncharacterized protein (TIGR02001 family)
MIQMKKMNEKVLAGVLTVSALAGSMMTSVAQADVAAAVGVSNMYYWRGMDLGDGDAAVWGDLKLSSDVGAYAGVWMSSGDAALGQEYDLYFGYGTKLGDFGIDLSYWTYSYPSSETETIGVTQLDPTLTPGQDVSVSHLVDGEAFMISRSLQASPVDPGDLAEIVLALSYGPVTVTHYEGQEDLEDYSYDTIAATFDKFGIKYGVHEFDFAHVDLSYSYNDKVSFILGVVADDVEGAFSDAAKFVINYSLPIE